MKIYSYNDLSAAKFILQHSSEMDFEGNTLYPENWIIWSRKVLAFFARLFKRVRNSIGHYFARLKLAWFEAKNEVAAYNKMLQKYHAKRLSNNSLLLDYIDKSLSMYDKQMNIRGKRSFRTKLRKKTDYQQTNGNKTFAGIPNEILVRIQNALAKTKSAPVMSYKELFSN